MELRIYIRHTQFNAIEDDATKGILLGDPILFVGANPSVLKPVKGIVPMPNYQDITEDVVNLDKLKITWTTDRNNTGDLNVGSFEVKKSASNDLQFEGKAYSIIKEWLVDNVSAPLNSLDIKIEHVGCGAYTDFVIRSNQVKWCEDEVCEISSDIQQRDPAIQCFQRTIIADNWQGWFQRIPEGGKKHPRFIYCNEARPNGRIIMIWGLLALYAVLIFVLTPVINTIIAIIGVIKTIIDAISWLLGKKPKFDDNFEWFDPSAYIGKLYVDSTGCGRMHPAPLIRDYIDNVCKKCGVKVDSITDPIFHSRTINIQTSSEKSRGVVNRDNPYFNACYMYAPVKRGLRMFENMFSGAKNTVEYYITDNRPLLALDDFLDEIAPIFNAQWRISYIGGIPHLYFWRKDWYRMGTALYDFTENGQDRNKLLAGICFNWLDKKQFAFMRGIYSQDAIDTCGNEALSQMNDLVALADKTNNRHYEGKMDKTSSQFGATRFRFDGSGGDYISDALQGTLINNPGVAFILSMALVPILTKYIDYCLLMTDETTSLKKIIIWDEASGMEFAKTVRPHKTGQFGKSSRPLPVINPLYNTELKQWYEVHSPKTFVLGNKKLFTAVDSGEYVVRTIVGADYYTRPAELTNYPMYFCSQFKDNLYDWFHWIDDYNVNPQLNLEFNAVIEMCCNDLNKLEVFNDSSAIALMDKVLVPNKYFNEGTITEITVNYDNEDTLGKSINIKGII